MKEQVITIMDLTEFIQAEIDKPKMSVRKVAKWLNISATTVQKIAKRRIQTMPEIDTLQRIADNSGLTLPVVIEMAGAMLGDTEKYTKIARELERHPWIAEEWARLTNMTREQFKEAVDYIEWREKQIRQTDSLPPNDDQSNL